MAPPSNQTHSRRPVGQQAATPARTKPAAARAVAVAGAAAVAAVTAAAAVPATSAPAQPHSPNGAGLDLPHDRDESTPVTAEAVDSVMAQAKADIDAGLVDTDMRATPGLDAELRAKLVPGPGGQTHAAGR